MRVYLSALLVCSVLSFASVCYGQSTAAVGDVNGDGHPDVVVANGNLNTISVFLNDGAGNLTAGSFLSLAHPVYSVHLADFNGDGHLDILAAQSPTAPDFSFDLFLGDGTGNFSAAPSVSLGGLQTRFDPVIADFNGDGIPDIAFDGVFLLFGDGHGGFSAPQFTQLVMDATYSEAFAADVNHDGKPDLVLNAFFGNAGFFAVVVAINDGAGNFKATVDSGFAMSTFGDFDGDGNLDFLLDDGSVIFGDDAGGVLYSRRVAHTLPVRRVAAFAPDFDHNTTSDILTSTTSYLPGNGHGGFGDPVSFSGTQSNIIATADLNGDGLPDFVVQNSGSAAVSVVLNTNTTPVSIAASTSTAIAASAVTTSAGAPVTLVSAVTSDGGVPVGSIAFSDGTTSLGSAPVNIYGIAAIDVPFTAGLHSSISAATTGTLDPLTNTVFGSSTSPVLPGLFVNPTPPPSAPPTVALTTSLSPARQLNPVTFSANVTSAAGTPTGNVVFRADGDVIGVAPLQNSSARLTVNFPTPGLHNVQATYGGDSTFPPAASATLIEDIRAFNAPRTPSTVQVSVNFASPTLFMNSTVTGATTPSNNVIYRINGAYFHAVPPGTQIGFNPAPGSYVISADYPGDAALAPGSASTTFTLNPPPPDFLIAPSKIAATISAGQSATFSFTITPINNFASPTTFSCSGLPAATSCSFSPPTLTPNGAPAITTLTITTTAPQAVAVPLAVRGGGLSKWSAIGTFAVAFVLLGGFNTKRNAGRLLRKASISAALVFMLGCGGGGGTPTPLPPVSGATPAGTSQITVTAASAVATHTQPITLTVQ